MKKRTALAEAQFIGFHHGKHGYTAKSLAEEMGLTKKEWLEIREGLYIAEADKEAVDELFPTIKITKNV